MGVTTPAATARADSTTQPSRGETRRNKSTEPLSPARIKRVHALLSSALGSAVNNKHVVEQVGLPRVPRGKPLAWTAGRVARWEATGKVPAPVMVWMPVKIGAFLDFAYTERLYAVFRAAARRVEPCDLIGRRAPAHCDQY